MFVLVTFVSKFNIRYVYFYLMSKLSIEYIIHASFIHLSIEFNLKIVMKSEFGSYLIKKVWIQNLLIVWVFKYLNIWNRNSQMFEC